MRPETQPEFGWEGRGLNQKYNIFAQKLSNLGPLLNKLMQLKRVTERVEGESLQPLDNFCDFAAKIAISTLF